MKSSGHKHSKTSSKQVEVDLDACALCSSPKGDEENFGKFFQNEEEKLAVHQFCLLFASGLAQNGEDSQGFDGFLYNDIRTEVKRAGKLHCSKCFGRGATIGCCIPTCRRSYHLHCGLKSFALFQYFDNFCVFCKRHRPQQSQPTQTITPVCPICLSDITVMDGIQSINSPCCKNSWFHQTCVQKQALVSGSYFFRCSLCNNLEEFQREMNRMGIYIPERDALWEQGDAYADLLQEYNKCDSETCLCPEGREFSGEHNGEKWQICLCDTCGQSGTHLQCKGWSQTPGQWLCQDCNVIHLDTESNTHDVKSLRVATNSPLKGEEDIPLSRLLTLRNKPNPDNESIEHLSVHQGSGTATAVAASSCETSIIVDAKEVLPLDNHVEKQKSLDSGTNHSSSDFCELDRKPKKISKKYQRRKMGFQLKSRRRAAREARKQMLNSKFKQNHTVETSLSKDESFDEKHFSLRLDVSVESETHSPTNHNILDNNASLIQRNEDANTEPLTNESLHKSSTRTVTPTKKLSSSSPKNSCPKTSPKVQHQQDLLSMFSSGKSLKRKFNNESKDDAHTSRSPKSSLGVRCGIKKRKLDSACYRSITTYMTVNAKDPSPKGKSRQTPPTLTNDSSNPNCSTTQPRVGVTLASLPATCLEGAKRMLDLAFRKFHSEQDTFRPKETSSLAVNKHLMADDSDTDSSSCSVKVVKITKKEPQSCDTVVISDDSDDHDSGKGGSRDNSDAGLSYVSSADSRGNQEDIHPGSTTDTADDDDDDDDDGIFLSCDDDESYFNCTSNIDLGELDKTEQGTSFSNSSGIDGCKMSQNNTNPDHVSKPLKMKKHKSDNKVLKVKKKHSSTHDSDDVNAPQHYYKDSFSKEMHRKKEKGKRIKERKTDNGTNGEEMKGETLTNTKKANKSWMKREKVTPTKEKPSKYNHLSELNFTSPDQSFHSTTTDKHELSKQDVGTITSPTLSTNVTSTGTPCLHKKIYSQEKLLSTINVLSSILSESSSDESLQPLRKKKRKSPSPKSKGVNLLKYSECSDEDFKSKQKIMKRSKDFRLMIEYQHSKKHRNAKKFGDNSNIDLSSEAPS